MNIKNIQSQKILKKILQKELKSGVNPTDETLAYLFKKKTKGKIMGMPFTELKEIKERERSDSKKYNAMLDETEDDLGTLFQSLNKQNKDIINNFAIQENEKIKLLANIQFLKNEIYKLLTVSSKSNPYIYNLSENFSSLVNIDLSKTDAFINLQEKNVSLGVSQKDLLKVPLSNASITINKLEPAEQGYTEELNSITNCIDDYLNTYWSYRIQYTQDNKPDENVSIELLLSLPDRYNISQVSLIPMSAGNTIARIYYLEDNSWYEFSTNNSKILNKKQSWFIFPEPKETDKIKIKLTKTEPDFDEGIATYIFGLKNISLDYREYKTKSMVVTKPLEIKNKNGITDFTIENISIETNDNIPSETDINYFIQIKENNNLFKNPDFEDEKFWNAEKYYDIGGVDGNSYCGDSSMYGMYQDVELLTNQEYTISGYVRMPTDNNNVKIVRKKASPLFEEEDIIESFEVNTKGEWTYFEHTFNNLTEGTQLFYIQDSELDRNEIQADKFSLVEGTEANIEEFSNSIPISPINKQNPRYKQKINFNNIMESSETFDSDDLIAGDSHYNKTYNKYNLKEKPILQQVELIQGVERWKVGSYQRAVLLNEPVGLYLWNQQKKLNWDQSWWLFPNLINFDYEYKTNIVFDNMDNMHYLYSTWLYLDNPQSICISDLNYDKCFQNESLYINNSKLKKEIDGSTYSYNIQFQKGWNKIILVIYLEEGNDANVFNQLNEITTVLNNNNWNWRAEKEVMKQVSLHDLYTNYDYEDNSIYAIDNQGNIIINKSINNNYITTYKYNINRVNVIKILAELSTNNPYITPKIDDVKVNIHY